MGKALNVWLDTPVWVTVKHLSVSKLLIVKVIAVGGIFSSINITGLEDHNGNHWGVLQLFMYI